MSCSLLPARIRQGSVQRRDDGAAILDVHLPEQKDSHPQRDKTRQLSVEPCTRMDRVRRLQWPHQGTTAVKRVFTSTLQSSLRQYQAYGVVLDLRCHYLSSCFIEDLNLAVNGVRSYTAVDSALNATFRRLCRLQSRLQRQKIHQKEALLLKSNIFCGGTLIRHNRVSSLEQYCTTKRLPMEGEQVKATKPPFLCISNICLLPTFSTTLALSRFSVYRS